MTTLNTIACPRCNAQLSLGTLRCPECGSLIYLRELHSLSQQAAAMEATSPIAAAEVWRQCLNFLPPESNEYASVAQRASALASGFAPPAASVARPEPRREARSDTFNEFLFKTGGSMALSLYLYAQSYNWKFSVAFVLLIFIHEMGHVTANWYYGLKQSAPIFLGYFGAVIMLRQNPPNAKVESIIGIAGPVFGTIGALACYWLALRLRIPELYEAAAWGFFLNAFNLLPVPPLDGGRAAAGLSPFLWGIGAVGLLAVEAIFYLQFHTFSVIGLIVLLWVLQSTVPRLRAVLLNGGWRNEYYRTSLTTKLAIAGTWAILLTILVPLLMKIQPWKA